ncbi:AMP-binding protein [Ningiella sp. W23]|uniref:AMP-binding protein n=1 Tax=Ningiella sp. W23 TaxID=3023715 RepID=UPI0037572167
MANIYFNQHKTSFQEFSINSRKMASVFEKSGVKSGESIALLLRNDIAIFEAIEACRYLELSFVPLNWHSTAQELRHVLLDSGSTILLAHSDLLHEVQDALPQSIHIIVKETPNNIANLYKSVASGKSINNARAVNLSLEMQEALPIACQPKSFKGMFSYTSGSTGRPKGIRREINKDKPDLYAVYEQLAKSLLQLNEGDRYYICAPLYHSAPNALSLCCVAARNVDIYIEPKFEAQHFLADIERYKITHVYIVPTMMIRLLKLPDDVKAKYDVSSLKYAISSGSPWPADVKASMIDWFGPIFFESYGASEIGFMTLISSQESIKKPGSVGTILTGGSIMILDENHQELPVGESGLIYVYLPMFGDFTYTQGDVSSLRYKGHTTLGDVGYVDADGYLFINDRQKDMVISGGANIFPAEIEALILQMPQVLDCAVFGIPDTEFGEKLVAAVCLKPNQSLSLEALHTFLQGKIARFKYPQKLDIHDSLPRQDSGKIFKQKLREAYN